MPRSSSQQHERGRLTPPASRRQRLAWLTILAWAVATQTALAQIVSPSGQSDPIHQRLAEQDAEIAQLRSRLGELQASLRQPAESSGAPNASPASSDSVLGQPATAKPGSSEMKKDDGWKDVSAEKWSVKFGGQVQGDYITWVHSDPAIIGGQNYFEFRRLRLQAEGTGYGVYDFRLQLEFEPEAEAESGITGPFVAVKDAYYGIHEIPGLGYVRFGNFYVPVSVEQSTGNADTMFLERSIPVHTVFTPQREVGLASYNISANKKFTWAFGGFFDSISEGLKERVDDNQGTRVSGRVAWTPYYDEPSNGRYLIHAGVGVVYTDDQDDTVRFRTRPHIHEGPRLIDTGNIAAAGYAVFDLELATVWGPFSIQSELFATPVDRIGADDATLYGSYIQASYFLTGENRVYEREGRHYGYFSRVKPFTNFWIVPGSVGWGAWEAKARWSFLDFSELDRGRYDDLTVGFNWYWTERARVMFDWIHPRTSRDTTFGATESDILAMRMEYSF